MTFSIIKYIAKNRRTLGPDSYLIKRFNKLNVNDQRIIQNFLAHMNDLKGLTPYVSTGLDNETRTILSDYAAKIVDMATAHILNAQKDNYQRQLQEIDHINQYVTRGISFATCFTDIIKETPADKLISPDKTLMLKQWNTYLENRRQVYNRHLENRIKAQYGLSA